MDTFLSTLLASKLGNRITIKSSLGPVAFATRSGDQACFSPNGRYLPVLAIDPELSGGETRWALFDKESLSFTEHHARAENGATNNDFQWAPDGNYWMVKGARRHLRNIYAAQVDEWILPAGYQWRTMACAGRELQGVHGWHAKGDMVLSFSDGAERGRFSLDNISEQHARNGDPHLHIRNAVPFMDGWMFSPRDEDDRGHARYEHWCRPDGSEYQIIEPTQSDGRHMWSHQGTHTSESPFGIGSLITTEPTKGEVHLYEFTRPNVWTSKRVISQEEMQEVCDTEGRWTTAEHFQNDGTHAVFSVSALKPYEFIGIYCLGLRTGVLFEVDTAKDKSRPVPDGQLPRPTFHGGSEIVAWVEDGSINIVPMTYVPEIMPPPRDQWRIDVEKDIKMLKGRMSNAESILRAINDATE